MSTAQTKIIALSKYEGLAEHYKQRNDEYINVSERLRDVESEFEKKSKLVDELTKTNEIQASKIKNLVNDYENQQKLRIKAEVELAKFSHELELIRKEKKRYEDNNASLTLQLQETNKKFELYKLSEGEQHGSTERVMKELQDAGNSGLDSTRFPQKEIAPVIVYQEDPKKEALEKQLASTIEELKKEVTEKMTLIESIKRLEEKEEKLLEENKKLLGQDQGKVENLNVKDFS